jgi:hypothetical protein
MTARRPHPAGYGLEDRDSIRANELARLLGDPGQDALTGQRVAHERHPSFIQVGHAPPACCRRSDHQFDQPIRDGLVVRPVASPALEVAGTPAVVGPAAGPALEVAGTPAVVGPAAGPACPTGLVVSTLAAAGPLNRLIGRHALM